MRGPLHGIPVLIKDNIDTADRMHTTRRLARARRTRIAARDAFVAERLRAAGAVILGKTNLSEWANFRSTHSSSGWSGRGGQTRNPYALDRNAVRLELGLRRGGRRQPLRGRRRHRDRRLDRLPVVGSGARRHQADGRPDQPRRHHPDRAQPGHGRPDGAHRARRRGPARRADRRRPARRGDRDERGHVAADYTDVRSTRTACAARASASARKLTSAISDARRPR